MQNVPWYMDLVGAGFTNHGGNAAGILIDTESGGHVELDQRRPGQRGDSAMPDRFFTVDELYNTNRNPVGARDRAPARVRERGLARRPARLRDRRAHEQRQARHVLVPQLRRRPLVHDGARPQLAVHTETWYQQHILAAVEWTAGVGYLNCVTFNEVSELLAAAVAAGDIDSDGQRVVERVARRRGGCVRPGRLRGRQGRAREVRRADEDAECRSAHAQGQRADRLGQGSPVALRLPDRVGPGGDTPRRASTLGRLTALGPAS